jgi:hypothetical protein
MTRPFSKEFLTSLQTADEKQLGVQLGRLTVEACIPASFLAKALGVTRTSIYSWFRGQDIRHRKRKEVEVLIDLMKEDFKNGVLPVSTQEEAKKYIQELIGEPNNGEEKHGA